MNESRQWTKLNLIHAIDEFDTNDTDTLENLTKKFWQAVGHFAPEFLVGDFSMETDTSTGDVYIKFQAK